MGAVHSMALIGACSCIMTARGKAGIWDKPSVRLPRDAFIPVNLPPSPFFVKLLFLVYGPPGRICLLTAHSQWLLGVVQNKRENKGKNDRDSERQREQMRRGMEEGKRETDRKTERERLAWVQQIDFREESQMCENEANGSQSSKKIILINYTSQKMHLWQK